MDVSIDVILGGGLDDSLGSFDVDILEGEVPVTGQHLVEFLLIPLPRSRWPMTGLDEFCPGYRILRGVVSSDEVVDYIRVTHALLDGLRVPQVVFLWGVSGWVVQE